MIQLINGNKYNAKINEDKLNFDLPWENYLSFHKNEASLEISIKLLDSNSLRWRNKKIHNIEMDLGDYQKVIFL
jgi:hypothetical protein